MREKNLLTAVLESGDAVRGKNNFEMRVLTSFTVPCSLTFHLFSQSITINLTIPKGSLTFVDYDRRHRASTSRYPEDSLIGAPVDHVIDRVIRNGYTLKKMQFTWQNFSQYISTWHLFDLRESLSQETLWTPGSLISIFKVFQSLMLPNCPTVVNVHTWEKPE